MVPQSAFPGSFGKPTETTFDQLVSNQTGLFTSGPVIPTFLPDHAHENFRVYIVNRMPINFCTPTHCTPAFEHRYDPFQNKGTMVSPAFSYEHPIALYVPRVAPVRSSVDIEYFPPAISPSPVAPVTQHKYPARISTQIYPLPLSWRGGHRIKTSDKFLALGSACLILNRFQSLSGALASGSKSPIFVQERALMLALTSAFGSVKLLWMMCEQ